MVPKRKSVIAYRVPPKAAPCIFAFHGANFSSTRAARQSWLMSMMRTPEPASGGQAFIVWRRRSGDCMAHAVMVVGNRAIDFCASRSAARGF